MTEWIDIKDRQPEDGQRVLAYFPAFSHSESKIDIEIFDEDFFRMAHITHWLPIPNDPLYPDEMRYPLKWYSIPIRR